MYEKIAERMQNLEARSKRNHEHLLNVSAGQRERIDRGFAEVRVGFLEHEAWLKTLETELEKRFRQMRRAFVTQRKAHKNLRGRVESGFEEIRGALLEQERAIAQCAADSFEDNADLRGTVMEMADEMVGLEERLRVVEDKLKPTG